MKKVTPLWSSFPPFSHFHLLPYFLTPYSTKYLLACIAIISIFPWVVFIMKKSLNHHIQLLCLLIIPPFALQVYSPLASPWEFTPSRMNTSPLFAYSWCALLPPSNLKPHSQHFTNNHERSTRRPLTKFDSMKKILHIAPPSMNLLIKKNPINLFPPYCPLSNALVSLRIR